MAHALAAGGAFTCALHTEGGTVLPYCWGANAKGQLGIGKESDPVATNSKPVLIGNLSGAKIIGVSAGGAHACAWTDSGKAKCWGDNAKAQLGYGELDPHSSPPTAVALASVDFSMTSMSLGYSHSCALGSKGARCWGSNTEGELGLGISDDPVGDKPSDLASLPETFIGGTTLQVSIGKNSTCLVTTEGALSCYGIGPVAGLGLAASVGKVPNEVGSNTAKLDLGGKVREVATGYEHACAILDDGSVKCWGNNTLGQLGSAALEAGITLAANTSLAAVPLGAKALTISAGGGTTCAIVEGGRVKCWGNNASGQLGLGNKSPDQSTADAVAKRVPFLVREQRVVGLAVGTQHVCASVEGGNIYCWGENDNGQLGVTTSGDIGDEAGEMEALISVDL